MKIEEIMTKEVVIVRPEDSIQAAAQKMRDHDIGFLPVYDGDKLLGVLSDRDMAVRSIAEGKDPANTPSRDVITKPVICCYSDQEVGEAARMMHDNQIRRLVVLDREHGHMVGVISLGDIATNSAEVVSGEALQGISRPEGSPDIH